MNHIKSRYRNLGPSLVLSATLIIFLTGHPAYHTLTQNVATGRYYLSYQKTCDVNEPAQLLEFSQSGQLVRSLLIPKASQSGFQPVSDVIALSNGSMALLHGFPKTSLHVYSPQSQSWKSTLLTDVVLNSTSFGAFTSDGRYAFFPASSATPSKFSGIMRLDPNTGTFEYTPVQGSQSPGQTYRDLQWNADGKLYALVETTGKEVSIDILDANTLTMVGRRQLTLPVQSTMQSLAVNQRGEIYLLGEKNQIFLFASSAQLVSVATLAPNENSNNTLAKPLFSDLDLDQHGMVLASDNASRSILAINQDLTSIRTISRLEQMVNSEISGDRCSNAYISPLAIES